MINTIKKFGAITLTLMSQRSSELDHWKRFNDFEETRINNEIEKLEQICSNLESTTDDPNNRIKKIAEEINECVEEVNSLTSESNAWIKEFNRADTYFEDKWKVLNKIKYNEENKKDIYDNIMANIKELKTHFKEESSKFAADSIQSCSENSYFLFFEEMGYLTNIIIITILLLILSYFLTIYYKKK